MKRRLILFVFWLFWLNLTINAVTKIPVIPQPKKIIQGEGEFKVTTDTGIHVSNSEFMPLARLLQNSIRFLSGLEPQITSGSDGGHGIEIVADKGLSAETYTLEISDRIRLTASAYNAAASGLASLIQLMTAGKGELSIPRTSVIDNPDYRYRTVLVDLARFWHPIETVKETINLLWFYKIRYLHLHLTDNRRFTFTLDEYPDLRRVNKNGSREYYTDEELADLVEYAKHRGVVIIPEVELPGHSSQLWSKYPETFGSIDPVTKKTVPLYVVNMAKEECYRAVDKIIKKLAGIFYTSPYIHFGADEVYLAAIKKIPEYRTYCTKHDLKEALKGDASELYCHFINRVHRMVKAAGKRSIIWEGFPGSGSGKETIPRDITVVAWNTTYNHPADLVANGYKIVNATWIPWYFVGAMNMAPSPAKGYSWDINQWRHWDERIKDTEIPANKSMIGGQICFWEQNYYKVIPILRERVPVLAERLWNNKRSSTYAGFSSRFEKTDRMYRKLFRPVTIQATNLLSVDDLTFTGPAEIEITSEREGVIKYTVSPDWGLPDMRRGVDYRGKIPVTESMIVSAQLFDQSGKKIGFPEQRYYQKIIPTYQYRVFGPAPNKGWNGIPDFNRLDILRQGISGKMSPGRLEKINGELFAKVKNEGHIETRFHGIYNPYALELKGSLMIKKSDDYLLRIQTHDGLAQLLVDGRSVFTGRDYKNQPEEVVQKFESGSHSFTIRYFYKHIQNQLSILYKTTGMDDFEPFESLVNPLRK